MMWSPISEDEMRSLLIQEVALLDEDERAVWQRYGIQPEHVTCVRGRGQAIPASPEPTYIIARFGDTVLLYDDVENEWGTGVIEADGLLHTWYTYGERLGWALRTFPEPTNGHLKAHWA